MKLQSLNRSLKDAIILFVAGELAKQDNYNPIHPLLDRLHWSLSFVQEINDDFSLWEAKTYSRNNSTYIEIVVHEKTHRVQTISWMKDTPKFESSLKRESEKPYKPENYGAFS